jgi:hypothetical protein
LNRTQAKFLKELVMFNSSFGPKTKAPSPTSKYSQIQREPGIIREESHQMIEKVLEGNEVCFKMLDHKLLDLSKQPEMQAAREFSVVDLVHELFPEIAKTANERRIVDKRYRSVASKVYDVPNKSKTAGQARSIEPTARISRSPPAQPASKPRNIVVNREPIIY